MLNHIVAWKYRADVEEEIRDEHVARLRSLTKEIKEIASFKVGRDVLGLPRSYDTGLMSTFRDRAAFEAYTVHPSHVAVAELGRKISEHVISVDFEDSDR